MALPTSGPLSFTDIAGELSFSSPYSLRSMSSTAGFSTPDAVSEFYGYSGGGLIAVSWGYSTIRVSNACRALPTQFYADGSDLSSATIIYMDNNGDIIALAGWFSDGVIARYWDGLAFSGLNTFC